MHTEDDDRRWMFLERLAESANVTESAKAASISRRTLYNWRAADADFAKAWDEANELGTDALEDEALRRGHQGVDEPVFFRGVECGAVRRYSDTLLIFMLKARRPDKFKDRVASEVSGPGGGPMLSEVVVEHHAATAGGPATGEDGGAETPPGVPPGADPGVEVGGPVHPGPGGHAVG
jgi:hypothetical protein